MIFVRGTRAPGIVVKYTAEEFRTLRLGFHSGEFDDFSYRAVLLAVVSRSMRSRPERPVLAQNPENCDGPKSGSE